MSLEICKTTDKFITMTKPDAHYRATVLLKALPGQEKALLDLTHEYMPRILQTKGLQKVEVNQVLDTIDQFVFYYWWESPQDSADYVAGSLYAELMPKLKSILAEHTHIFSKNLFCSGEPKI